MNERMDETRFAEIVSAYGAQARRWPEAERAQALIFARDHADAAERLLVGAREVDDLLDMLAEEPATGQADQAAEMRILSGLLPMLESNGGGDNIVAFRPRRRHGSAQPWLWTGVGLAACVAGAVVGAHLSLMSIGDLRAQTVLAQVQIIDGDSN
ncbi:MAG: hypothetical protein ACTHLA_12075 [Asticcacaulis sp.]|uniref:hypothetical protein n=1 Tax=Asticcacaulis sp. TaxID=1872648 RepID=UPI003F7B86C7